jgi:hypothetical protein
MTDPVTAIVFYGDHAASEPERLMQAPKTRSIWRSSAR